MAPEPAPAGRARRIQVRIALRQLGLRHLLGRAAFGYLRPHRFVGLRCAPAGVETAPVRLPEGLAAEVWHRSRLAGWRRGRTGLPVEFFQDEIHDVETCAVVHARGEPVGLIWIYGPRHYSRFFRLRPGEAELNYGYVLPACRGRGVFQAALRAACGHVRDAGGRAVYAAVHAGNAPSLAAFRSVGFRDVGTVRHFLIYRPRLPVADLEPAGAPSTSRGSA